MYLKAHSHSQNIGKKQNAMVNAVNFQLLSIVHLDILLHFIYLSGFQLSI